MKTSVINNALYSLFDINSTDDSKNMLASIVDLLLATLVITDVRSLYLTGSKYKMMINKYPSHKHDSVVCCKH